MRKGPPTPNHLGGIALARVVEKWLPIWLVVGSIPNDRKNFWVWINFTSVS